MKAIILAAGRGTRISRHIDGKPKCTVRLNHNVTLIEYTIGMLKKKGIDDVTVVLGYRGAVIRDLLAGRSVRFVENPFFDVTNSIASLWFARDGLCGADRLLIMNGDVFLSEEALDIVLSENRSPVLFYDTSRRAEADYKFFCNGDKIIKYGKDLSLDETSGEYVGCAVFDHPFVHRFTPRMEAMIRNQNHSMWWEDVLYSMSSEQPVLARDLSPAFWAEVDYVEDYMRIMSFCRGTATSA